MNLSSFMSVLAADIRSSIQLRRRSSNIDYMVSTQKDNNSATAIDKGKLSILYQKYQYKIMQSREKSLNFEDFSILKQRSE